MGWKGYEFTAPLGMLFRKMYCHKCGNKLKKKKESRIFRKGEPGYSNDILGQSTIGMDRIEKAWYVYWCPDCNTKITYGEQCIIAKEQKKQKKKILKEDEWIYRINERGFSFK